MNGINKITDRIAAEAGAEIEAMHAEALQKCKEIGEACDNQAQEKYRKLMDEGRRDAELQGQRLAGAAVLESKKNVLAMKQEAVSKILDLAADRICSLPEDEYVAFLTKLASGAAITGEEEIILNARDRAAVGKAVVKSANDSIKKRGLQPKLSLSEAAGDFKGGLMVKQGDIVVNCSVETMIEMSRDKLASQIAEILFSE